MAEIERTLNGIKSEVKSVVTRWRGNRVENHAPVDKAGLSLFCEHPIARKPLRTRTILLSFWDMQGETQIENLLQQP